MISIKTIGSLINLSTKFSNSGLNIKTWLWDDVIILSDTLCSINVTCYFIFYHCDDTCIWGGYVNNIWCVDADWHMSQG
jgi:hypothetical protein